MRTPLIIGAIVAATATVAGCAASAPSVGPTVTRTVTIRPPVSRTLPPCPTEDATAVRPCLWDAATRGNHKGRSFIITRNGMLIYLDGGNLPPIDPQS
jgi:hypothetical protein